MNLDEQRQRTAAVSGCWLMAGAAYVILEAVAAAAYRPDYSYAHNSISDLGQPSRQSAGATIGSGFASAMVGGAPQAVGSDRGRHVRREPCEENSAISSSAYSSSRNW
jgi:hypothetical protein